ncbi:hypothetical protein NDU88_009104 [Pleurodeles waltl]|uniref:Uncharacterized protein n=1 Tax=Pleurodeles waltl TaxID=8319 RepID=A0AAV7QQL5_PLEWA|nr:hypothetical protein NDU88_009104 [Pleurodeles waltl]
MIPTQRSGALQRKQRVIGSEVRTERKKREGKQTPTGSRCGLPRGGASVKGKKDASACHQKSLCFGTAEVSPSPGGPVHKDPLRRPDNCLWEYRQHVEGWDRADCTLRKIPEEERH